MCIMEVTPGQRTASIAMAMAHNLSTVDRDLDMFRTVLEKRGEHEKIAELDSAQAIVHDAYKRFLEMFGTAVGDEIAHVHSVLFPHEHGDSGNERVSVPHSHDDGTTHTHDHDSVVLGFSKTPDSHTADPTIVGKTVKEVAEHYAQAPRKYMTR